MSATTVRLVSIRTDGGTQSRVEINDDVVNDYAAAYRGGATFPPPEVFYDGTEYWLADGFHRVAALKLIERDVIGCVVHQGTRRDAVLFSVGANATHGLRRTNADKRRAVKALLADEEWSQWSDREIARQAGVSDRFVNKVRSEVRNVRTSTVTAESAEPPNRKAADGSIQPAQKTCGECGEAGHDRRSCPVLAEPVAFDMPPRARAKGVELRPQSEVGSPAWAVDTLADGIGEVRASVEHAKQALAATGRALRGAEGPMRPVMSPQSKDAYRHAMNALKAALDALPALTPSHECEACPGPGCGQCRGTGWVSVDVASRGMEASA